MNAKKKSTQRVLVPVFTETRRPTRRPLSSKRRRGKRRLRFFRKATTPFQARRATNSKRSLGRSDVGNSKAPVLFSKRKSTGRRAAPISFAAILFALSSRRPILRRLPKPTTPRRFRRDSRRCESSAGIRSPAFFNRPSFVATEVTEPDFGNAKARVGASRREFYSSTGAPRRRSNTFRPAPAAVSIGNRRREPSKTPPCPTSARRRRVRSTRKRSNASNVQCLTTSFRRCNRRLKASLNKRRPSPRPYLSR